MSIPIHEYDRIPASAWNAFKNYERGKFPHFGKNWFDNHGSIYGDGPVNTWREEAIQYAKDRSIFIASYSPPAPAASVQVEKPPVKVQDKSQDKANNNKANTPVKAKKINKTKAVTQSQQAKPAHHNRASLRSNTVPTSHVDSRTTNMPRRTKRSQAWKKSGGRRRHIGNKALASVRVPFKMVMEVNSASSTAETGHWHNHLTIAELAGPSLKLHEEFKCCAMKVRFIPEDITTGSGLYAACLLDQNGFGDPVHATTVWFPRVADLPGARLCHVTRGCAFTWRPTEPDSRNFKKSNSESDYVVASFYIFGNAASLSIKGQLLITGLLRARGEFYSANIASRIQALSLLNAPDESNVDDLQSLSD